MFKQSLYQLKKPITITTAAMYIAIYVVLYAVKIPLALESRVSVTFLPLVASAYLMGPVTAMIVGAIGDILSAVFFPSGQYFPGFTLSAVMNGLIYGIFLYRANTHIRLRSLISTIIIILLVNVVLNTLWLAILYQKAFVFYLVSRFVKNIIVFPVQVIGTILCIRLHNRTGITKYYL
ncbi:MAG: folate family ECF transporter S component [Clostridia bacterium]|nr:folate family ECF transporter S component [Clostridia bacterium]